LAQQRADDPFKHFPFLGRQGVIDLVPFPPAGQDAGPAEIRQGMRGVGLSQVEPLGDFRDAEFLVAGQEHHDVQAAIFRQRPQEIQ